MRTNFQITSILKAVFLMIPILFGTLHSAFAEAKTTIILIDAQPVLVQLGPKGEIYERYIKVPEYFRSNRSHEGLVSGYKRKVGILSKVYKKFDKSHFLAASDKVSDSGDLDNPFDDEQVNTSLDLENQHSFDTSSNKEIYAVAEQRRAAIQFNFRESEVALLARSNIIHVSAA